MDIEKKIEFVLEAYRNTHNMIAFADTKANTSLSIQSLLISIGLGTSLLSNTFNNVHKLNDQTHIPHFKFIKTLFHEFPTAMNLPNEVCYTNLHSYS